MIEENENEVQSHTDPTKAHNHLGSIDFIDGVRAAIDAKTGTSAGRRRYPVFMVDAPVFQCSLHAYIRDSSLCNSADFLPPRRQADHLVNLYWNHHEPLLPLLDRKHFTQRYEALFTGVKIESNEAIFKATLNMVFALSNQLQESVPYLVRNEASDGFFQRAWSLLHPDLLVWGSPSLDLVQCLILMTFYLQCTEHVNQAWMVIGLAVRIGQSIGLNAHQAETLSIPLRDEWFRRLAWEKCGHLER